MGRRIGVPPHWTRRSLLAKLPLPAKIDLSSTNTDMVRYSDINWVIMDYLVSEGYPGAAEKFAQETNMPGPVENESIRQRVHVRNAIHTGNIKEAIEMVNEIDPDVSIHTSLSTPSR